ncbi:MAG: SRPBCC family protein [Turneriella sp.]
MKILKILLYTIAIGVAGLLAFAATRPNTFRVERSLDMKVPAAKIFPYVNDFRRGPEWSPWEEGDPAMKRTYSGAKTGKGAVYEWAGNKEVGKGRLETVESVENQYVKIAMHFIEPMEGDSTTEYILTPKGDTTNVKWVMSGPMNYVSKVMCVFFDMDKMIGGQFDKGLQRLKAVAEK